MRLRTADPAGPGIRRIRHGRGFRYVDAAGAPVDDETRRQYLYHPEYRRRQDEDKHRRVLALARRLPAVREAVTEDIRTRGLTRRRVLAAATLTDPRTRDRAERAVIRLLRGD